MSEISENMREFVRLFVEFYFAWRNNGVPREQLDECETKSHFTWDCCPLHRGLKKQENAFYNLAETLDIQSEGIILSLTWFEDLADHYGFELPSH